MKSTDARRSRMSDQSHDVYKPADWCKKGVALKMTSSKPPAEPLPVEMLTDFSMSSHSVSRQ